MELHKSSWPGWETTRLIGRGSFGAVYEIERRLFEDDEPEKAALKVISIPQNDSDIEELYNDGYDEESVTSTFHTHLKSIVAEYSLMRKMNGSSNIVNCDDVRYVQHEDGIGWDIYIKMELLTPLAKALPAVVSEKQIIRIAMDMCNALELCGKHNIIHRDIKPQNIFVSENGDYKLGDFGIAKTVEKTMGGTKTGTYKYMAPEVYSNKPYNSTADIYSLGLVLYWLLNERRMPFMPLPPEKLKAGMDEESRNRRFSGEKIPAPKNGSKELKRIVLKACAFESKDRYQSAREMREDLLRLSDGQTTDLGQEHTQVLDFCEDTCDRTVGPNFKSVQYDDMNDHDQTVGPVFGRDSVSNSEKTVGPNFSLKEGKEKKDTKRNRSKPIAAIASLMAVCVLCTFFFGKDTEHDIGFAKDSKQQIDEEFQISEDQLSFNRVGDKVKLTANRDNVTWSTSDPMVASINSAGEVTIIGPGNAEIRSDWNGQTRICYVTVDAQQGTDSDYAVALNQLAVIEKYNEQYTTYSYVQLDDVYNEYVAAGGQIEPHSYPGTLIKEEPHANIRCYLADWYYVLKVEYNDSLGELIYEDVYNVITDKNQIDGSKPPYSTWSMNNHSFFYTIHSSSGTFHRYDNPDPDVIVKDLYGADYIDDGVTRCITVWADSTQKIIAKDVSGEVHKPLIWGLDMTLEEFEQRSAELLETASTWTIETAPQTLDDFPLFPPSITELFETVKSAKEEMTVSNSTLIWKSELPIILPENNTFMAYSRHFSYLNNNQNSMFHIPFEQTGNCEYAVQLPENMWEESNSNFEVSISGNSYYDEWQEYIRISYQISNKQNGNLESVFLSMSDNEHDITWIYRVQTGDIWVGIYSYSNEHWCDMTYDVETERLVTMNN